MKMKHFFVAFVLICVVVSAFYLKRNNKSYDTLLLNIEALANNESGGSCWGYGSLDCPWDDVKVFQIVRW